MDHVFVSRSDLNGYDVARKLGSEGKLACGADGAVLGHEDGSAAGHALQDAEDSAPATKLRVRRQLDRTAHPRELSGFGDDGLVGFEGEFQYGHGGAGDPTLHEQAPKLVWRGPE
jgi:hypothetical protein